MRILRWLFGAAVAVALLSMALDLVEPRVVLAPLIGLAIARFGIATIASFGAPAPHVPQGPPTPLDTRAERILYWCEGCGAEVLLLVRGADTPPRHCGERMVERREVHGPISPVGENSVD